MSVETRAPLFTDTFQLCEWLLRALQRNPGPLARALCGNALRLLEAVTLALKRRRRDEALMEADEILITLRVQLRLAGTTDSLSESQVLHGLECADRIGRQLGGWMRSLEAS